MSVTFYDEGILNKLREWTKDTHVSILNANNAQRLFEMIASDNGDKPIKLPIIALRRKGGYTITNPNKQVLTFDARLFDKQVGNNSASQKLNAIPIHIEYQIDVYTRHKEECDEYIREIVFNIINKPTFEVTIPYRGADFVHNANLQLSPEVEDNSDISERLIEGQFTRFTLNVCVDDAYLWDINKKSNKSIVSADVTVSDT